MAQRLYIYTVGCQMNVLDSELVLGSLLEAGYQPAQSPRHADVILLNTCSVRQHAEDKIYSLLGRLKAHKDQHPHKILGVLGCMAQKDREEIFKRAPHVDLVVGPGQLGQVTLLLERLAAGHGRQIAVSLDRASGPEGPARSSFARFDPPRDLRARPGPHQAIVRIMSGCNRRCSYCVVPSVRGPEQCRPPAEIEQEVRRLADQGCLEVTLLGQTVNSYRGTWGGRTFRLADLLERLQAVEGIQRLRFATNHPQHMTDQLLQAVRDLAKVCPHLHVPAQSGSNRILRRMKRGYTAEAYRDMLARIRQTVPQASVTSDFIVGFCGETEEDFQQTLALLREGRFKNSFIFKYSPRPGTQAAELYPDDVPEPVKRRRNHELLAVQNAISQQENRQFLGRTVEILVEGPSKTGRKQPQDRPTVQLVGRTPCDRIVVFDGPRELIGRLVPVEVTETTAFTLFGKERDPVASRQKARSQ
ncbi:MAG: tRNA (N6-isopentenyl adenosine(37)-C2)-methylthiotransferase MiaB [Thermoguttaceae bacterium]